MLFGILENYLLPPGDLEGMIRFNVWHNGYLFNVRNTKMSNNEIWRKKNGKDFDGKDRGPYQNVI